MVSDTSITCRRPAGDSGCPRAATSLSDASKIGVDGVGVAVTDRGEGPTLVCLHAVGHGSGDFRALRRSFEGRARVVTLDWPGHGRSDDDREPCSAGRYEQILAGVLDALDLRDVILVGNSIGGAVALRCAVAQPTRVRALVLCDVGGLMAPSLPVRLFCRSMAWAYAAGQRGAFWFEYFFRLEYAFLLRGSAAREQRERIVASGVHTAPVLEEAWRSFAEPEADIRHLVPQVRCPVMLAWARSDPFNSHYVLGKTLRRFQRSVMHTYPGGHAPFLEAPERFARDLSAFLDTLFLDTVPLDTVPLDTVPLDTVPLDTALGSTARENTALENAGPTSASKSTEDGVATR